jgi:hypothetical protein
MAQLTTLVIRISPDLKGRLRSEALKENINLSEFARKVLQSHFNHIDNPSNNEQRITPAPPYQERPTTSIQTPLEDDDSPTLGCPF